MSNVTDIEQKVMWSTKQTKLFADQSGGKKRGKTNLLFFFFFCPDLNFCT